MADAVLKTPRGKPCRYVNGFSMCLHRVTGNRVSWRCTRYNKGCSARGASTGINGVVSMTSGDATSGTMHNHAPDPTSPEKRKRKTILKDAATANRSTPSTSLAAEAQEGLDDETLQSFPSQRALQQAVNRARKIPGAKNADLELSEFTLPEALMRTLRGDRFLLTDTYDAEPDKPRILAYVSPNGVSLLRENDDWALDGTFYAAPRFFDNLLTINVFKGKESLPAAFILLPNRTQETYDRALEAVFGAEELRDVEPKSYTTDFELSLTNSLAQRFPTAESRLCIFHYAKALWTNVQKKGLLPVWNSVQEARTLLRCFMALPMLPPDEVIQGFKDVCNAFSALIPEKVPEEYRGKFRQFTDYVARTYIGIKVNGRFVRARYDLRSWNCHERILLGLPRSNNSVEGWHAYLNRLFPKAHVALSQFVHRIQKEEERIRNIAMRNLMNPAENLRGRPAEATLRDQNIHVIVHDYSQKQPAQRNKLELLVRGQFHLSPTAFARLLREDAENQEPGSSQESNATPPSTQEFLAAVVEGACSTVDGLATAETSTGAGLSRALTYAQATASATALATSNGPLIGFSFFD